MLKAQFFGAVAIAFASLFSLATPSVANAAPGTCKCNSGCHASPGQCVKGAACNIGYAPTCGYRSGAAECPKVGYISCDGTCTCTPIPGFCESIGGAEYCDSGAPDTSVPDTFVPDTFVPDTFVPDTFVPDTFVPDTFVPDTFVPPTDSFVEDTFVPDTFVPDTFVEDTFVPDTFVPDTYVEDTFVPDVDSCVPLECLPGTKTIVIPGECDPFCAQPAGGGEFKCSLGFVPVDGFCLPKCMTTGFACADCKRCSLGDGTCFDDITACDGGVPDGFEGGTTDTAGGGDGSGGDGTVVEDTSVSFDTGGTGDDATVGDSSGTVDTGDPFGPAPDAEATTETQGGCGCSVPGTSSDTTLAALAGAAALALVFARRRRDD